MNGKTKKYLILGIVFTIFLFGIIAINNTSNIENETTYTSVQSISNKKIGWGIKRNNNHMQPDLGAKNIELIEKYNRYCYR